MMDALRKELDIGNAERLEDRDDATIYLVRVFVPSVGSVLSTAVQIDEQVIKNMPMGVLMEKFGLESERLNEIAAEAVVMGKLLELKMGTEKDFRFIETRAVRAAEVVRLSEAYGKREGN